MSANIVYKKFRGVQNLVAAEVLQDDAESFVTGEVFPIAGMASMTKTTEQSSETTFYDNFAALTVLGEGADTITFGVSVLPLSIVGKLTGQQIDVNTGALIEGRRQTKYFCVGYQTGVVSSEGDRSRYVWRLKGTFQAPDETSNTVDTGTGSEGQTLIFTGINTIHKFTNGYDHKKGVTVEEGDTTVNLSTWFDTVKTPDNLTGGVTIDSRLQSVTSDGIEWYPTDGGFNAAGPYAAGNYKWASLIANEWAITFTIAEGATAEYVWADVGGIHTGTVSGQTSFTLDENDGRPSGFQITVHGLTNGVAVTSVYNIFAD